MRRYVHAATAAVLLVTAASAQGATGSLAPAQNLEAVPGTSSSLNTPFLDGCPAESRDGLSLFMASTRPGGESGIDIWVAHRPSKDAAWGAPVNLGAPVNGAADDFCPTPVGRRRLLFVSSRPGGCGGADIYVAHRTQDGWAKVRNLGCRVNSAAGEAGPSLIKEAGTVALYFSSNRPGGFAAEDGTPPDSDIYRSERSDGGFGAATLVPGVNTSFEDARPNVRKDGLELFLDSTRPGTLGGPDLYVATRSSVGTAWSDPVNLGPDVNTTSAETRPWITTTGLTLYFGSNRPGSEPDPATGNPSFDLYFTTREQA